MSVAGRAVRVVGLSAFAETCAPTPHEAVLRQLKLASAGVEGAVDDQVAIRPPSHAAVAENVDLGAGGDAQTGDFPRSMASHTQHHVTGRIESSLPSSKGSRSLDELSAHVDEGAGGESMGGEGNGAGEGDHEATGQRTFGVGEGRAGRQRHGIEDMVFSEGPGATLDVDGAFGGAAKTPTPESHRGRERNQSGVESARTENDWAPPVTWEPTTQAARLDRTAELAVAAQDGGDGLPPVAADADGDLSRRAGDGTEHRRTPQRAADQLPRGGVELDLRPAGEGKVVERTVFVEHAAAQASEVIELELRVRSEVQALEPHAPREPKSGFHGLVLDAIAAGRELLGGPSGRRELSGEDVAHAAIMACISALRKVGREIAQPLGCSSCPSA